MDRRTFVSGITVVLAGMVYRQVSGGTPEPMATPEPSLIARRQGIFHGGKLTRVGFGCHLAVHDSLAGAEAAGVRKPEFGVDPGREISVIGPQSVDMPDALEDLPGSAWHAYTLEGAAAAETVYEWIIVQVDRAVWTFSVVIPPGVVVEKHEAREAMVPAIEAVVRRAPDPTPDMLTPDMLEDMLPMAGDFYEPVEWIVVESS